MIASWMAYGAAVSLLLGLAAAAVEATFLRWRFPIRWVWATSIVGSLVLPPAAWLLTTKGPAAGVTPGAGVEVGEPVAAGGELGFSVGSAWMPSAELLGALQAPLLFSWLAVSSILIMILVASALELRRRRRAWPRGIVAAREVLLSENVGPAVVGVRRFAIVIPSWAAALDERRAELMLRHEEEHIHARDPHLLYLGLVCVIAIPWALPLWWQLRRLRLAIEIDCDRRVLRDSRDAADYGALLLEVDSPSPRRVRDGAALCATLRFSRRRGGVLHRGPCDHAPRHGCPLERRRHVRAGGDSELILIRLRHGVAVSRTCSERFRFVRIEPRFRPRRRQRPRATVAE